MSCEVLRFLITMPRFNKDVSCLPNRKWNSSQKEDWMLASPFLAFQNLVVVRYFLVSKLFFKKAMPPKAKNNGKPKGKKPKSKDPSLIQDYALECKYFLINWKFHFLLCNMCSCAMMPHLYFFLF